MKSLKNTLSLSLLLITLAQGCGSAENAAKATAGSGGGGQPVVTPPAPKPVGLAWSCENSRRRIDLYYSRTYKGRQISASMVDTWKSTNEVSEPYKTDFEQFRDYEDFFQQKKYMMSVTGYKYDWIRNEIDKSHRLPLYFTTQGEWVNLLLGNGSSDVLTCTKQ